MFMDVLCIYVSIGNVSSMVVYEQLANVKRASDCSFLLLGIYSLKTAAQRDLLP